MLQLLGYLFFGGKLLDVAQRIQPTRPPWGLAYLVDILALLSTANGLMVWLHLLVLAFLREGRASPCKNGITRVKVPSEERKDFIKIVIIDDPFPSTNSDEGWVSKSQRFIGTQLRRFVSSIRVHISFAIFFETVWTIFLVVDGWAFTQFGIHVCSTTVWHMLLRLDWFLDMAHIDAFKIFEGVLGFAIVFGIQAGIFFLCGLIPCSYEWLRILHKIHCGAVASKRMLLIIPLCYVFITACYLSTPLPYEDGASATLPLNYASLVASVYANRNDSCHLPYVDVNKQGMVNADTNNILHPNLYPRLRNRKNVLMLLGDSLRADWYNSEHTAESVHVREFLSRNHPNYSCSSFPDHFTNGHTTEGGMFSMMYSLWPELNTV